ncbi:hypothetical protein QFZ44_000218 [Pantoea agglomerans]|nr:hypothetical protein [Pantoea agglomerans]
MVATAYRMSQNAICLSGVDCCSTRTCMYPSPALAFRLQSASLKFCRWSSSTNEPNSNFSVLSSQIARSTQFGGQFCFSGLSAGRPAGCTRPPFSLAQVRKPGAAVVVAAQALPELKPDVVQFRRTRGVAADAKYKCPKHATFGEAVPSQPGGKVRCTERAHGPSDIRVFPQ